MSLGIDVRNAISWFAHVLIASKLRSMALPKGWLPVNQAEKLPEPDTSWMSDPLLRKTVMAWLG
jgi:hypothetical protein